MLIETREDTLKAVGVGVLAAAMFAWAGEPAQAAPTVTAGDTAAIVIEASAQTPAVGIRIPAGNIEAMSITLTSQGVRIVRRQSRCSGHPTVGDTRLCVHDVVAYAKRCDWDLELVAEEALPHIPREEIEAALEYYREHTAEIEAILEERRTFNHSLPRLITRTR